MKNFFLMIFCLCSAMLFSQNMNHPTIDKVQTSYKAVPSSSIPPPGGSPNISVRAETSITLKTTGTDKIYLKMMDAQNNILYQVNYGVNAQALTDAQGNKLFYKEGNIIHIGNPNTLSLKPYKYEIYTEDGQGNASLKYIVNQ